MYYHRGLRIRPEMQEFRLGVQKSQEAIENTIGSKSLVHPYALDELTFHQLSQPKLSVYLTRTMLNLQYLCDTADTTVT